MMNAAHAAARPGACSGTEQDAAPPGDNEYERQCQPQNSEYLGQDVLASRAPFKLNAVR